MVIHTTALTTPLEFTGDPAGNRTQMTGLEDPSRRFMLCGGIPPGAASSPVTGRRVAPSVTACRPCGGQKGGQDFGYSSWCASSGSGGGTGMLPKATTHAER